MAVIIMGDTSTLKLMVIAFIVIFVVIFKRKKFNRHKVKIDSAKTVINKLFTFSNDGQRMAYLKKIDPYVFEELVLFGFEYQGQIERNKRYSGDGGIDGRIWIGRQLYLIQAKRYTGAIQKQHVIDFISLVNSHGCKGVFCHTGTTSDSVKKIVKESDCIELISGSRLLNLISIR